MVSAAGGDVCCDWYMRKHGKSAFCIRTTSFVECRDSMCLRYYPRRQALQTHKTILNTSELYSPVREGAWCDPPCSYASVPFRTAVAVVRRTGGFRLDGLSGLLLFILNNMPFGWFDNRIPQTRTKGNYILMNKL